MAEHQEALQAALPLQGVEAEQGAEGLAGTGAGVDEHVVPAGLAVEQAGPQELDQAHLPLPWPDPRGCRRRQAQIKGGERHRAIVAMNECCGL